MAESWAPRVVESWLQLEGARSPEGCCGHRQGGGGVTGRARVRPCARPCAHTPHLLQEKRHFHLHLSNPPQSVAAQDARGPESPWTLTLLLQLVSQGERRPGRPGSQSEPGLLGLGALWIPCLVLWPGEVAGESPSTEGSLVEKPQDAGGREARVREPQPPGLSHLSAGDPPGPEPPVGTGCMVPRSTGFIRSCCDPFL